MTRPHRCLPALRALFGPILRPPALAALLFGLAPAVLAQTPTPSPSPRGVEEITFPAWSCELPGGTYTVALSAITAVSFHEYLVDGAARVTEVTVDTSGATVARFYHLEPPKAPGAAGGVQSSVTGMLEKLEGAATSMGVDPIWRRVVKNYPIATHAHTVEYRLENRDQLMLLFASVDKAWKRGRGAQFKLVTAK